MPQAVQQILAADIGGTNSRFAAFALADGRLSLANSVWLKTGGAGSFADLMAQLADGDLGRPLEYFDALCFAVPGPVEGGVRSQPANIPWAIDISTLEHDGLSRLINDFAAQAYACIGPAAAEAQEVWPGTADPEATLGVIGAGTGLGHAAMVRHPTGGHQALPSEAGHASFPFVGAREDEYHDFVRQETGEPYATGDLVVSGSGLARLHAFLTGRRLSPPEAAAAIGPGSQTTRWFARFYARAARNFALTVLCRRGLYISGGVAAKNPFLVLNDTFRDEFILSPVYGHVLKNLPVWLNTNEMSGLWGAAGYGAELLARRKGS